MTLDLPTALAIFVGLPILVVIIVDRWQNLESRSQQWERDVHEVEQSSGRQSDYEAFAERCYARGYSLARFARLTALWQRTHGKGGQL